MFGKCIKKTSLTPMRMLFKICNDQTDFLGCWYSAVHIKTSSQIQNHIPSIVTNSYDFSGLVASQVLEWIKNTVYSKLQFRFNF